MGTAIAQTLGRFRDSLAYSISMWVMELLVLLLIAYEVFGKLGHDRNIRKRSVALNTLLTRGVELQSHPPYFGVTQEESGKWNQSVTAWVEETAEALQKWSTQAAATFRHGVWHAASYPNIAPASHSSFGLLSHRLDNLRKIMEKPEVYY